MTIPNIQGGQPVPVLIWNDSAKKYLVWTGSVDASVVIGAVSSTIVNSAGWVVNIGNPGDIGGGYQYPTGSSYVLGNSGNAVWAVNSVTGLYSPFFLDADNNLKTVATIAMAPVSSTILNSAGWVVAQSNTSDLVRITNSAGWIFSQANTSPSYAISNTSLYYNVSSTIINTGGYVFSIANTGWISENTALVRIVNHISAATTVSSTILNSAGWVVAISNTARYSTGVMALSNTAGWIVSVANTNNIYSQANTSLYYNVSATILNTGGYVFSMANTMASYAVANTRLSYSVSSTILNTAGWVVGISNTSGWIMSQANTLGLFRNVSATILNSGNWIVNVANTGGAVSITGDINLANTAGWIVSQANTQGSYAISNTAWVETNTALCKITNPSIEHNYNDNAGTYGLVTGGRYQLGTPESIDDNDYGQFLIDAFGRQIVNVANTLGLYRSVSSTILNSANWVVSVANTGGLWKAATSVPVTAWKTTNMTTSTGNLLTSAANGSHHELFHLSCNNGGASEAVFLLVNSNGGALRRYYLAKSGGIVEAQFNPPVALSNSGNLYYSGAAGGDINISLHYRTVAN